MSSPPRPRRLAQVSPAPSAVRSRRLCGLLLFGLAVACADPEASTPPLAADTTAALADCADLLRTPDGQCCPPGTFYDFATDSCPAPGPRGCSASVLDAPEDCWPRWCWDWRDVDGQPCEAGALTCLPWGRACSEDEHAAGQG